MTEFDTSTGYQIRDFSIVVITGAVIPDKETAYAMAAGYGVQSVVENERVQKIAGQGVDVLEQYLEKTKKELEKEAAPQK